MTFSATRPDVTRPDARIIATSELAVSDPAHQRPLADAMLLSFERSGVPWPDGLLAHAVLLGTDGVSLQHYAQWASLEASDAFVRDDPPERRALVRSAAPGLEPVTAGRYTLYRSLDGGRDAQPGCIVIVNVEFEGPDPQRQRDWVDAVINAIEADGDARPQGGLSTHFHVSVDGTRVINYAGWVSEAAHIAALAANGGEGISAGPLWDRVQHFPGLTASRVRRFLPYRSIGAPVGTGEAGPR